MVEERPQNRIRELREQRQMSLRNLATVSSVDFSTLGRFERGVQALDFPRAKKIANALGVRVSELLLDEDVELRADEQGRAILNELRDLERSEVPAYIAAAKQIVGTAHRLAAQHAAGGLGGDPGKAGQLADMWRHWDEPTRAKALKLLDFSYGGKD